MVRRQFDDTEKVLRVLITVLTNFAGLPCIWINLKRRWYFGTFITTFTLVTSFMYHLCNSIQQPLWLSELKWHRLDNVGSITCFSLLSVYLTNLDDHMSNIMVYIEFFVVLLIQEKDPWDEFYTLAPVVFFVFRPLVVYLYRWKRPDFHWDKLRTGGLFLVAGFTCFIIGLDDDNDPLRIFHGLWHTFVGLSFFQLLHVVKHPVSFVTGHESYSLLLPKHSSRMI